MKEYKINWFSPLEGINMTLADGVATNNPTELLFNYACRMIVTHPFLFNLETDNIKRAIKTGKNDLLESYFIEFKGDEFLFCLETTQNKTHIETTQTEARQ